jgi:glycosyltransferase involved in cell wall biosynthesis
VHFTFGSLLDLMQTYRTEQRIWGRAACGYTFRAEAAMLCLRNLQASLERRIAARADKLIVPCTLRREEVVRNFRVPAVKVTVVPLGVEAAAFQPQVARAEVRRKLGLDNKAFVFLTVGQSIWRKGILWLLEAVAGIRRELTPDVQFVLAGFPQRELIEQHIRQRGLETNFRCLGVLPHAEVHNLYALADAFVLPSVEEGFGLVILEAVAAGLPLVTTRIGCAPDLLTHGRDALVVELRDAVGMGAALLRVWREPELRERLRTGGRAVAAHWTWERTAAGLHQVYAEVLG